MAFMTKQEYVGITYIIKMVLDDGTVIYKVGVTARDTIYDRLSEILISMFKQLRYVPRTTVKRCGKSNRYEHIERSLLKSYESSRYIFDKKFSGSTEFIRCADECELLGRYDNLIST